MTFKRRLTFAAAIAVAVAVALASLVVYVIVKRELRREIDVDLSRIAATGQLVVGERLLFRIEESPLGGPPGYAQLVGSDGDVLWPRAAALPVSPEVQAVAEGDSGSFYEDLEVNGMHIRVLTRAVGPGFAVQVARPLEEVDTVLGHLRWILLVITGCGIALAAGLGGLVTRAALSPVKRLMMASEHVTQTNDLSYRIEVQGNDEISRLAVSFNAMLDALERAQHAQRQLVADASHELRTPLTSLRTNIEVLANEHRLTPRERDDMRRDILEQLDELTVLIGDVVELARGHEPALMTEEVQLHELVEASIERTERAWGNVRIDHKLTPALVRGMSQRLMRAINNLLDNAAKWSPAGGAIEVTLASGVLTVRDHGPGIAEEDLPHIFDRFYRSQAARGTPGSGLGLAIVREVAEAHGGRAEASNAPGGGALFRLYLPTVEMSTASESLTNA
jgi:two-component system, OmpR family, sensor histidine kinase MprB